MNFKISNIEEIEYKDHYFDGIFCFHLLEHVKNIFKARDEIYRVLKTNGYFFGESPHWTTMFTPIGYNFFDDPSHIRPFSVIGLISLINRYDNNDKCTYDVLYKRFDITNFMSFADHYGLKKIYIIILEQF